MRWLRAEARERDSSQHKKSAWTSNGNALVAPMTVNMMPTIKGRIMTAPNFCLKFTEGPRHSGATISMLRLKAERTCRSCKRSRGGECNCEIKNAGETAAGPNLQHSRGPLDASVCKDSDDLRPVYTYGNVADIDATLVQKVCN